MKFGLFFELSVPRPLTPAADRRMYELSLEQVKLADEPGFDKLSTVEHHFLEQYSHSSAPDLWLTSVACHTKNIRIGHGICTLLPAYNHPIRAAERAAWLDIISGGRLEFGTGRSTTWTELGGFGIDPDKTKEMWDDSLRAIPTIGINPGYPASAYNTPGLLFALRRDSMAGAKALIKDGFCIGDPDDVIASLRRWESIGCDGIMFLINSKQTIPQERVLESLRLFAREVMPKFKDREPLDLTRPAVVTTTASPTSANGNGKTSPVAA